MPFAPCWVFDVLTCGILFLLAFLGQTPIYVHVHQMPRAMPEKTL